MDYLPVPTWEQYEIAKRNGISKSTVDQRIKNSNLSVEEAISKPLPGAFIKKYKKYIELAVGNGICFNTFRSRMYSKSRKWTPEEASTIPVLSKEEINERKKKVVAKIKDEEFAVALSNGISKQTLRTRAFTLKWDMERATTEPPNIKHRAKKGV